MHVPLNYSEWLEVYIFRYHLVRHHLEKGSVLHIPRVFGMTKISGFGCPLLCAWTSTSVITLRGESPRRTSIAAVGVVLLTPLMARQANLCTLISSSC